MKFQAFEQDLTKYTLASRIIGGVGIIGGLDIVIIINIRGVGKCGGRGGVRRVEKIVQSVS